MVHTVLVTLLALIATEYLVLAQFPADNETAAVAGHDAQTGLLGTVKGINLADTLKDINEKVDKILEIIRKHIADSEEDPYDLEDICKNFSNTIGIPFHGELNLTKGSLEGLSGLERTGDVDVHIYDESYVVELKLLLNLTVKYDFAAKFMGLGPTGNFTSEISNLVVGVSFVVEGETKKVDVLSVEVFSYGPISLVFKTDSNILDFILKIFSYVVKLPVRRKVVGIALRVISEEISSAVIEKDVI